MGKNKLSKFAEMATYPHVFEPAINVDEANPMKDNLSFYMKGKWNEQFFHNDNPIVLELGCGKGEYTVGLARMFPNKNFIGIDIKGARMWSGATESYKEGMKNVAFLRTRIEFIEKYFGQDEVGEIWLTFSDPQMKKPTKRLTSTYFMQRYRSFLKDGGIIHLKTDSNFLFTYTEYVLKENGIKPSIFTRNLYTEQDKLSIDKNILGIKTYYEQQWIDGGIDIKYLSYALPRETSLKEPDVEIEFDEYRSFGRNKRAQREIGK